MTEPLRNPKGAVEELRLDAEILEERGLTHAPRCKRFAADCLETTIEERGEDLMHEEFAIILNLTKALDAIMYDDLTPEAYENMETALVHSDNIIQEHIAGQQVE